VILTRNQFFLLLFMLVVVPFLANKIIWLANSRQTNGRMWYTGHGNLGSALGISTYAVIRYRVDKDSLYFNNNVNLDIRPGTIVPVRYKKSNPSDAVVDDFVSIWVETLVYALFPILILLVLFLMPERFDPIIPKKSKVVLGKKPFIQIVH
jgi:hypothetical protein